MDNVTKCDTKQKNSRRKHTETQAEVKTPCEDGGRNWSDAFTMQTTSRIDMRN